MSPELIADLAALMQTTQAALLAGFFVFLRVGAAMALLPAFGEQSVPQRVKLSVSLGFTLIVTPAVAPELSALVATGDVVGLALVTEVVAGLAIGISLRLLILALQMAGTIAAQSTSLSQFFGGAGVEPQPAISQLLVVSGLALAVMAGLHVRMVELLMLSYDVMPAGAFPRPGDLADWGMSHTARAVTLAFSLAAPFVIASLIYNVALGIINRAMPQLVVSLVGAPALALGGLLLLVLVAPLALAVWTTSLGQLLSNPFELAR